MQIVLFLLSPEFICQTSTMQMNRILFVGSQHCASNIFYRIIFHNTLDHITAATNDVLHLIESIYSLRFRVTHAHPSFPEHSEVVVSDQQVKS